MEAGTALRRDSGATRGKVLWGGALLLVGAGLGYLATLYGFMAGLGAVILGFSGLAVVGSAFAFSGKGPCPSCGHELRDVPRELDGVACHKCGAYARVKGARLFPTPDNFIAMTATYAIALEPGEVPPLPALCVTCGAPAEGVHTREMSKSVLGLPGVGRVVKRWTVPLPLCAGHQTPDSLGNPPGVTSYEGVLKISSHRVWRELQQRARG